MDNDLYWEIYEMFEDQLINQLNESKRLIKNLQYDETVETSLEELFRYYHTYKATSSYLELLPMHSLVTEVESVLGALREINMVVQNAIIQWLEEVTEQMLLYADEMSLKKKVLSHVPTRLINAINVTKPKINPKEKLATLSLLYIDNKTDENEKLIEYLDENLRYMKHITEKEAFDKAQNLNSFDIIMVNLNNDNHEIIKLFKEYNKNIPIISIFKKITLACSEKLLKNGVYHNVAAPISIDKIEQELFSIIKTFYSGSHIIIDNKKIKEFITTLEPLPSTIFKVIQVCDNDEIPIKDLIKIVKTDPIISANILQIANSPIYGSIQITSVDQAIAKFGKVLTKAFCLSDTQNKLGTVDLSAYDISQSNFSNASIMRLAFMLRWYSKVSTGDLSVLTSSTFLSSLGSLLISKEIVKLKKTELFQKMMKNHSVQTAEESLLNTNSSKITSQILRYWKLPQDIITVIEHTDYPEGAPSAFNKLCAANFIVNTLVSLQGKIVDVIPEEVEKLITKYQFDKELLEKTMQTMKSL